MRKQGLSCWEIRYGAGVCSERENRLGGKFFIYGKGGKAGSCWWETTPSRDCPEGWEEDAYDFYEIQIVFELVKAAGPKNSQNAD